MFLLVIRWWEANSRKMWVREYTTITEVAREIALLSKKDDWKAYEIARIIPRKLIESTPVIAT